MSSGYIIYSLDWVKFRSLIERPTKPQLKALGGLLAAGIEEYDGEFDEGDPIGDLDAEDEPALVKAVTRRLALPDWYSDLTCCGKAAWEGVIWGACMENEEGIDVGFRVDSDGVYWDVIEIAMSHLGQRSGVVALSAFGTRPYRYFPGPNPNTPSFAEEDEGDWSPMHSLHTPDETARMLAELRSAGPAVETSGDEDALHDYRDELMPALERIADDQWMLFIQVDT